MSDAYTGPERRAVTCENHETNTKDISRIKGWLAGITLIGGSTLTLGVFILGVYMNSNSDILNEIRSDIKQLRYDVSQAAVIDATTRIEVDQLKKDVTEIKMEIIRLHREQR